MNEKDSEAASKLAKAAGEIEVLLYPDAAKGRSVGNAVLGTSMAVSAEPDKMNRFCAIVIGVAVVNFVAFLIGAAALGGDAINGKEVGGRYYVADHGKLTEVSRAAFNYSRIHGFSMILTHSLGTICAVLCYSSRRKRGLNGSGEQFGGKV